MFVMHLKKQGGKTACGTRGHMATDYATFMDQPTTRRCERCAVSKQAFLTARNEAQRLLSQSIANGVRDVISQL